VARFVEEFLASPRCGEVYNLGGGRENSCSILEAFERVEHITCRPMQWQYVDQPRAGDHICYISDLSKMMRHYPNWSITKSLNDIFCEIAEGWTVRA
jgi:CDP-paratose 2-epimerase